MANVWKPNRGYSFLKPYVNFCCKSIFSRVRVSGLENVPTDGYVMYAPNHCATLMDPLLLLTTRRGPIAFGARYDIFRNPRVAKMLNWMRILPLARERDGLKSVSTNFETFDDIVDCLGHGVPFCMFSEGRHRPERGMLPVKKGIFRVCKLALDRLGGPVYIVPVGLDYQYFFRQGGSVDLRIGKPIDIEDYMTRGETAGEAAAYRELCEVLQQRILALIGKVPERKGRMLLPRLLAALVLLPLTDHGIPATASERIAALEAILAEAERYGYTADECAADALIMTISANPEAAQVSLDFIEHCTKKLKMNTVCGLSNVSFGLPDRAQVNLAFLGMALGRGLSGAIANPSAPGIVEMIRSSDALSGRDPGLERYLAAHAGKSSNAAPTAVPAAETPEREASPAEQLYDAVLRGRKESALQLIDRVLAEITAKLGGNAP